MAKLTAPASVSLEADVLFSRILDGGGYGGLYKIANVTTFGVQPQSESESIQGTERDNFNQTLDTLTQSGDFLVNMTANRFNGRSIALGLLGTEYEISAGNEVISGELVAFDGNVAHMAHESVTGSTVAVAGLTITVDSSASFAANRTLTNTTTGKIVGIISEVPNGTTIEVFRTTTDGGTVSNGDEVTDGTNTATASASAAKTDGAALTTDFTVDETLGRITRVASGALDMSLLDRVVLNYTRVKTAGSGILVAANTNIKGRLVIKGKNRITLKRVHVDLREVTIAPNADIPFIGTERMTIQWQGTAATPSGFSEPGIVELGA